MGSNESGRANPQPLAVWLARRRRARWIRVAVWVAAVGGLLVLRGQGPAAERVRWERQQAQVLDVVDGRTLRVRSAEASEATVRLLGVTIGQGPPAEQARAWLAEAAAGDRAVRLSFDNRHWLDAHGRLAAYVYFPDGRMANESLIELGLARADDDQPHALAGWFERLGRRARAAGRGLWAER